MKVYSIKRSLIDQYCSAYVGEGGSILYTELSDGQIRVDHFILGMTDIAEIMAAYELVIRDFGTENPDLVAFDEHFSRENAAYFISEYIADVLPRLISVYRSGK